MYKIIVLFAYICLALSAPFSKGMESFTQLMKNPLPTQAPQNITKPIYSHNPMTLDEKIDLITQQNAALLKKQQEQLNQFLLVPKNLKQLDAYQQLAQEIDKSKILLNNITQNFITLSSSLETQRKNLEKSSFNTDIFFRQQK